MRYDFDTVHERRGTNSYKWDNAGGRDVIPMWVADMDFKTAPCIIDALRKRVDQGIFGYTSVPDSYYDAVIDWFGSRHGLKVERDEIIYTSGVVPALSAAIKALTSPGDKVIVQTPVYNCFFSSIRNNGCIVSENSLIYEDCTYHVDFDDLERKASDPEARLLLLCNPHNPAGRVWTEEELIRIGEICFRHDVTVVSDEIHCEIVFSPHRYVPFASISEDFHRLSVTCCSPSKAFNIAGLQIANIFAKDKAMRLAIDRAININEVCDVNPFGVIALTEAYNNGSDWLEQMVGYVHDNYLYLKKLFEDRLPDFKVTELQGTYLAWIDCSCIRLGSEEIAARLLDEFRVLVNSGEMYGDPTDRFIRINLATPRRLLEKGLERVVNGLLNIKSALL